VSAGVRIATNSGAFLKPPCFSFEQPLGDSAGRMCFTFDRLGDYSIPFAVRLYSVRVPRFSQAGGVGRGCGVGRGRGVTLRAGVADGVAVGVAVPVGLGVGVNVAVGVGVGVDAELSSQVSLNGPLLS
jgi:hypothetical protein